MPSCLQGVERVHHGQPLEVKAWKEEVEREVGAQVDTFSAVFLNHVEKSMNIINVS